MAQSIIATQGPSWCVNKCIHDIEAIHFAHKGELHHVVCRPIQLWAVVYPRQGYEEIMRAIFSRPNGSVNMHETTKLGFLGKAGIAALRRALGAKPFPPFDMSTKPLKHVVGTQFVGIMPIGYREDANDSEGDDIL